jgi:membrane-bound lytic murein transglycosylase F
MGKHKQLLLAVAASLLLAVSFWFLTLKEKPRTDSIFILDLVGIQSRGTLRVAVDNNSSSYYIYRGRRMGYEYELLLDLGKRLGVQIEFVVASEIEEAFRKL